MEDNTIILACSTLRQELELVMEKISCKYPVEWVDSGLHVFPDKLKKEVHRKLCELDPKYTTVLLLFGFCGNSMVDIEAYNRTLVLPLAADCIPIFLGSNKAREEAGIDTYFYTSGYLNYEANMVSEFKHAIEKYGKKRASYFIRTMMAHYKRLAVIDTGAFDVEEVIDKIKDLSIELDIPTIVLEGNLIMIENLLSKNWDNDSFLIVEPGNKVTFDDSLRVGKSLIC